MERPLQVSYRNVPKSAALEDLVLRKLEDLEQHGRVQGCRVVVEAPNRPAPGGKRYHVTLSVRVPGDEIVIRQGPASHKGHDEVEVAISEAFHAARRQLQDHERRVRGQTKRHEPTYEHGRIAKIFDVDRYGFVSGADGREVFFHENAVRRHQFDHLAVGDLIRFVETADGDGVRASVVVPMRSASRNAREGRSGRRARVSRSGSAS
jgi:cold shock CspA family protein